MNKHWRLIVVDDEEYLAMKAAECVKDRIAARRESVLALPAGRTPLKMYDYLVRMNERGEDVPHAALTMGVATILDARAILLMVAGSQKAGILARALGGPVAADVPASYLQSHPNLTVIVDRQAAAGLRSFMPG